MSVRCEPSTGCHRESRLGSFTSFGRARRHLRAIHDYIANDSPQYATRMVDRITRKSERLIRFPMSGHVVPEFEGEPGSESLRQVLEGSYRIIYRLSPDRFEVLAVIHGARNLPPRDEIE